MRSKIKVNGTWYKPVPSLKQGYCDGCVLDMSYKIDCINGPGGLYPNACSKNGEFQHVVFIKHGKEAMAEYIAKRLEGDS